MSRKWDRIITWVMLAVFLAIAIPWLVDWYQTRPVWWDPVLRYMIHTGLKETLRMAVLSVLGATLIGITLGVLITIRFKPLQWLIRGYIEIWRGLPIIVTIFLIYFAFPRLDETLSLPFSINPLEAFLAATVGLILWGSAQVAEATRGAIQSIPREQHEASAALGFGWTGRHVFVIVPQAVRRLLPPLIGLLVNIVQNTTIAGLIGVGDVLETGNRSTERLLFSTGDAHYLQIYVAVFVFFFALSYPLTRLAAVVEKRLAS
ncbi:MAG: amino acid ABC transporter permease [Gaiellaceae bacterium]|jgi:His/Glu/Gln/Arg/opine family amino acid ABC transporter permease subunit